MLNGIFFIHALPYSHFHYLIYYYYYHISIIIIKYIMVHQFFFLLLLSRFYLPIFFHNFKFFKEFKPVTNFSDFFSLLAYTCIYRNREGS